MIVFMAVLYGHYHNSTDEETEAQMDSFAQFSGSWASART